jgi:putative transcriptional regulator
LSDQASTYSQLKSVKSGQQTLGQKLREWRESLGLTRIQVARACDVVESSVINWETNRHKPKPYPAQMKALCEILNFSLQDLSE